jgi:hypothetical protein
VAAEYLDDKICRCSFTDAFPVTIGDSRPSLVEVSAIGDGDACLVANFVDDGERNSGDEILASLLRRSCPLNPASGDEFLMLPIESDSSVAELDSSTLQEALSAISGNRKQKKIEPQRGKKLVINGISKSVFPPR